MLFGEEVGELEECSAWLSELIEPINFRKSSISGDEVVSAPTDYCSSAKWLSFNEVDFNKKYGPLGINEIKDIDSLVAAVSERFCYSGNIFFGNFGFIERSSNINDSYYVYNCGRNGNSKFIAYTAMGRVDENTFGCNVAAESKFCVKCTRVLRSTRCFEVWHSVNTSDCYYSSGLDSCQSCMFSFNAKNLRNAIGNLALAPSKYKSIKDKLISEMAGELHKKKRLPALVDIAKKAKASKPAIGATEMQLSGEGKDKEPIEKAFLNVTSTLFSKPLVGGMDAYSSWLSRHTRPILERTSAASGRRLVVASFASIPNLPKGRFLHLHEALALGEKIKISASDAESLSLSNAHEKLAPLLFFNVEMREGQNKNIIDCTITVDSSDCYRSSAVVYTKFCGYSFWLRSCQYLFGCDSPFDSTYCINCYSCTQLTRCFEIDCCGYCSDSYFCHNCENVRDSMFCFNVKNLKYSIGNSEFSREEYLKAKSSLLSQISDELNKSKDLKYDIYNIGCIREK